MSSFAKRSAQNFVIGAGANGAGSKTAAAKTPGLPTAASGTTSQAKAAKSRPSAQSQPAVSPVAAAPAVLPQAQAPQRVQGGSLAQPSSSAPITVPGNMVGSGVQSISDLLNRFKDNETVTGLGVGTLFDIGRTQANTGLALAYNDAFMNSMGTYQKGLEDLKTGNTMKLMGVEGAIARDMVGKQGEEQRAGIRETGDQERQNIVKTGEQQRLGFAAQGEQERLGLQQKTSEELRLRADARGAIRSQGARFYG